MSHPKLHMIKKPAIGTKFQHLDKFIEWTELWQLGEGYVVRAVQNSNINARIGELRCTESQCPFNIVADYTEWTEGKMKGKVGWTVAKEPFEPNHSHDAVYFPVDLSKELERREAGGEIDSVILIPKTAMSIFLYQINPALLNHYEIFKKLGFFEDISISAISQLNEVQVGELLSSKDGISLPPFAKAEVSEGIRRARERMQVDPNDIHGAILREPERERALRFIQSAMDEGAASMLNDGN